MLSYAASCATFAATTAALFLGGYAAAGSGPSSALAHLAALGASTPSRRALAALAAAAWAAAFRKNLPLAWHVRVAAAFARAASAVAAAGRGFAAPAVPLRTRHRVLLGDLDFNMHMNNACYAVEIDIQRMEWLTRFLTGAVPLALPLINWGWKVANGGVSSWFLVELRLGAAYDVVTRLGGIDEKWLYLVSEFVSADARATVHAVSVTRIVIKRGRLTVPPADVMARLGYAAADVAALRAAGAGDWARALGARDARAAGPARSAVCAALAPVPPPRADGAASPQPADSASPRAKVA
jgi:acyl-CoA thioesterase FadM